MQFTFSTGQRAVKTQLPKIAKEFHVKDVLKGNAGVPELAISPQEGQEWVQCWTGGAAARLAATSLRGPTLFVQRSNR